MVVLDNLGQAMALTNHIIKVVRVVALEAVVVHQALVDRRNNHNNLATLEHMDLETQAEQIQIQHHILVMVAVVLEVLEQLVETEMLEMVVLVNHIQFLVHQ